MAQYWREFWISPKNRWLLQGWLTSGWKGREIFRRREWNVWKTVPSAEYLCVTRLYNSQNRKSAWMLSWEFGALMDQKRLWAPILKCSWTRHQKRDSLYSTDFEKWFLHISLLFWSQFLIDSSTILLTTVDLLDCNLDRRESVLSLELFMEK